MLSLKGMPESAPSVAINGVPCETHSSTFIFEPKLFWIGHDEQAAAEKMLGDSFLVAATEEINVSSDPRWLHFIFCWSDYVDLRSRGVSFKYWRKFFSQPLQAEKIWVMVQTPNVK